MMTTNYIFSFTEPINPEQLKSLFAQTSWANTREPLEIQQMLDHSQLTLGVWDEDRLIGFARVITDDRYRALVDDVVVDSAHRKRGVASAMLDKLLKRLQHIEAVMLECAPELEGFYGKFGFAPNDSSSMKLSNSG